MTLPKSKTARLALARRHEDARRFEVAHRIYDALLISEPDNPLLHARKGVAYFLANRPSDAIFSFDRALLLHPHAPVTLEYRARAKEQLGDLDGALRDYRRCIRQGGPDPDVYVNVGLIHEYRHNRTLARAAYKRALSLAPRHTLAINCLRALTDTGTGPLRHRSKRTATA